MRGLCLWACLLLGCKAPEGTVPQATSKVDEAVAESETDLTPETLNELTKSFADEYVTLVATATEYVVVDNPDIDQRRLALRFRSLSATAMYDIVTNENPFTQLVDLVVAVSLQCRIWIDDGQADDFFGDRADYVVHALYEARRGAWRLAARAFTSEQLSMLDGLIWVWRARNPDVRIGCFIRFADFADSRAKSLIVEAGRKGGLFGGVSKAVSEAAIMGERVKALGDRIFFISKRSPVLMEWQLEQALTEMLAQPEMRKVIDNQDDLVAAIRTTAATVDEIPELVSAEREAILREIDAKSETIGKVVDKGEALAKEIRGAISDGQDLLKQSEATLRVMKDTLEVADRLVARVMPTIEEPTDDPFRIQDYTVALQELTKSLIEANKLLDGTDRLLEQEAWKARIDEISEATDRIVASAADEGVSVTTAGMWRTLVLMTAFFVLLVGYRFYSVRIAGPKQ